MGSATVSHCGSNARRLLIIWLALLSVLAVPAAISWACNPQAQLTPDKASYAPGEAMVISGAFFPKGITVKVTLSSGQSVTASTDSNGAFTAVGLTAPAVPGNYTATATRADGQFQNGLPKVVSFSVMPPASTPVRPGPFAPPGSGATNGNFNGNPTLRCGGRMATLVGTEDDDVINGSSGRDVIAGLDGDDVIRGLGANDVLCGGRGSDRLAGGRGDDRLGGGTGDDRLRGGIGRDRLNGGSGQDLCLGGPSRDSTSRCETRRYLSP